MDGRGFDDLARRLATGRSRRSVLRGLIGGGAALVAARAGTALADPPAMVDVCQLIAGTGSYAHRTVNEQAAAAFLYQGGFLRTDCCTNADCQATPGYGCYTALGLCTPCGLQPGDSSCL
jgi:hypothetical protein